MFVGAPDDYVVGSFFAVRTEHKKRSFCFLAKRLQFVSIFKRVDLMLAWVHCCVLSAEGTLIVEKNTRSRVRPMMVWLDLLPLRKRVCLGPSTSLGSFFLSLRIALIDLGFSVILQQCYYRQKIISCRQSWTDFPFSLSRQSRSCTSRSSGWVDGPHSNHLASCWLFW